MGRQPNPSSCVLGTFSFGGQGAVPGDAVAEWCVVPAGDPLVPAVRAALNVAAGPMPPARDGTAVGTHVFVHLFLQLVKG